MITLYRPGRSILHRLPAGAKLVALAVLSLGLASTPAEWTWWGPVTGWALVVLAGESVRGVARILWRAAPLCAFLTASVWLFQGPAAAAAGLARVASLVLFAAAFARSTSVQDMVESWPWRRIPRLGLAMRLVLSSIPVLQRSWQQVRDAQRARGLRPSLTRTLVPFLVVALQHADAVDEAMLARGVR